jgi:hypothetical protein
VSCRSEDNCLFTAQNKFLLIGADEDQPVSWPLGLMLGEVFTISCSLLPNTIELKVVIVKGKAEGEG